MKIRSRNFKNTSQVQDFWPSFADVMSTIAMILFFLMLLSYIQNVITGRNLEYSLDQLTLTELALGSTRDQLDLKEAAIADAEANLVILRGELESTRDEIELTRAEVERGRRDLEISELEVDSQREIIASSNLELAALRGKLQEISVIRLDILDKVKASIEDRLGRYTATGEELVTIGESANIVINETLVFAYGSAEIKEEARPLLEQFAIAFEEILDDPDVRGYIDMINIEGHTDSRGSAAFNRNLSSQRAVAVVDFMMQANPSLEEKYGRYFGVTGFSFFRPIALGEDEESMQMNRRIEISVIVKDSNISDVIDEYLDEAEGRARGGVIGSVTREQ